MNSEDTKGTITPTITIRRSTAYVQAENKNGKFHKKRPPKQPLNKEYKSKTQDYSLKLKVALN